MSLYVSLQNAGHIVWICKNARNRWQEYNKNGHEQTLFPRVEECAPILEFSGRSKFAYRLHNYRSLFRSFLRLIDGPIGIQKKDGFLVKLTASYYFTPLWYSEKF